MPETKENAFIRSISRRLIKLTDTICECLPRLTDAYCRYVDNLVAESEEIRETKKICDERFKRFVEVAKSEPPKKERSC